MRFLAGVFVLLGLVGPLAAMPEALEVEHHAGATSTTIHYRGHVMDVIRGEVKPGAETFIPASSFAVGFAAGSPEGLRSLGEFMAVNGTAYAKSTDVDSASYYETIHGPGFVTTGAIFLPHAAAPTATVTLSADAGTTMTLAAVYEALFEAAGDEAFVYTGSVHFAECQTLAISRAPIEGEVIFDHREKYYTRGKQVARDVHALVMGAGADFAREDDAARAAALERILYRNPYDPAQALSTHSHALILREPVASFSDVEPPAVLDVNHLLAQSVVASFRLDVFPIESLDPLPVE